MHEHLTWISNLQVDFKKDEQALRERSFFCFVKKASSPERKEGHLDSLCSNDLGFLRLVQVQHGAWAIQRNWQRTCIQKGNRKKRRSRKRGRRKEKQKQKDLYLHPGDAHILSSMWLRHAGENNKVSSRVGFGGEPNPGVNAELQVSWQVSTSFTVTWDVSCQSNQKIKQKQPDNLRMFSSFHGMVSTCTTTQGYEYTCRVNSQLPVVTFPPPTTTQINF